MEARRRKCTSPCSLDEHIQQRLHLANQRSVVQYYRSEDEVAITHFNVEPLMLEGHNQRTSNIPCQRTLAGLEFLVEVEQTLPDPISESKDGVERWPVFVLLRNFRMVLWIERVDMLLVHRGQTAGNQLTWQ